MNLLVNSSLRLFTLVLFEWAPKTQKAGKKTPWLANWLFQNIFQSVTLCVQIHKNSDFYQKKTCICRAHEKGVQGLFWSGSKKRLRSQRRRPRNFLEFYIFQSQQAGCWGSTADVGLLLLQAKCATLRNAYMTFFNTVWKSKTVRNIFKQYSQYTSEQDR